VQSVSAQCRVQGQCRGQCRVESCTLHLQRAVQVRSTSAECKVQSALPVQSEGRRMQVQSVSAQCRVQVQSARAMQRAVQSGDLYSALGGSASAEYKCRVQGTECKCRAQSAMAAQSASTDSVSAECKGRARALQSAMEVRVHLLAGYWAVQVQSSPECKCRASTKCKGIEEVHSAERKCRLPVQMAKVT